MKSQTAQLAAALVSRYADAQWHATPEVARPVAASTAAIFAALLRLRRRPGLKVELRRSTRRFRITCLTIEGEESSISEAEGAGVVESFSESSLKTGPI